MRAADRTAPESRTPGAWRALAFISVATILVLSTWFSTNAIAPVLESEKGVSRSGLAWLTIAVQLGFAGGTVLIAVLNLADLFNARRLFAVCALGAATLNLAVIPLEGFVPILAVRCGTGALLAGVYPPAMKIVSGWFSRGRGLALGVMVGALTLGSGSPHLLRSIFVDNWEASILGSSAFAAAGGLLLPLAVRDGPFDSRGARFNPRYLLVLVTDRALRLTVLGYLGHMWELYAMWAWIGVFLAAVIGARPLVGDSLELASALAFGVFVAGSLGCAAAGFASERFGRTVATSVPMILSGSAAMGIGFVPREHEFLITALAFVWGAAVIADSAQFSTAATELSDPQYRGTILTAQTGLGFALTAVSIRLTPVVQGSAGWGVAFLVLAAGPAVGTAAMLRLRQLPEALRLAGGRR